MEVKREVVARSALGKGERGASWLKNKGGPKRCGEAERACVDRGRTKCPATGPGASLKAQNVKQRIREEMVLKYGTDHFFSSFLRQNSRSQRLDFYVPG